MADSTTDYNNLDPLGNEAAVVDEVDAAVSGARKKPRAVDMVPEEPDAMAPDEEYQLTPAGRRERIGRLFAWSKSTACGITSRRFVCAACSRNSAPCSSRWGRFCHRSEILPHAFATSCVVCAPTWSRCRTR